jgi:hypothetical protein
MPGQGVVTLLQTTRAGTAAPTSANPARAGYLNRAYTVNVTLATANVSVLSGRYQFLRLAMQHSNTAQLIGAVITRPDGTTAIIKGCNIAGLVRRGHITLN